ncbi:MAG: glycosyltransferase, partial [Acidobacteriota bacterium]
MKTSVIIPIFRGDRFLPNLLQAIDEQDLQDIEVLVFETAPGGFCRKVAEDHGARWAAVDADQFDHAGTRTMAAREAQGEVLIFLSQDVLPSAPDTFRILVERLLQHQDQGAAYGRQVAPKGSPVWSAIKRGFIYRDQSRVRRSSDCDRLGFHTAFLSNAFAAYRREALEAIDYFGNRALMCEDVAAGASLLQAGWSIAYVAEAFVCHDHPTALGIEARRYFDIGASHRHQSWIRERWGPPRPEGTRFFGFGVRHLLEQRRPQKLPIFAFRCLVKLIAYRLGRAHHLLPRGLNSRLS